MHFNTLATSSVLIAAVLAAAEPAPQLMPYKLAKMSLNQAFGLMGRQASGYAPTQTFCGAGDDCPTACGAGTAQCASNDGDLHCFTPDAGQQCCPDGFGNACDEGYYCTDNSDGTWCCPNGTSLADCAALYGVSSLTSVAFSTTQSAPATTAPVSVTDISTIAPTTTAAAPTLTPPSNGTTTSPSGPVQFTGAANQLGNGVWPALALAAGAAIVM